MYAYGYLLLLIYFYVFIVKGGYGVDYVYGYGVGFCCQFSLLGTISLHEERQGLGNTDGIQERDQALFAQATLAQPCHHVMHRATTGLAAVSGSKDK